MAHPDRHGLLSHRYDEVRTVLVRILFLNLAVAIAKIAYGHASGTISILSDGFHSLTDAASNVAALVGLRIARKPPDTNHPYGHRKYETFASLGIAVMLLLGCQHLFGAAIERIRHPRVPEVGSAGFLIVLGTLAINLLVVMFERREGRRLESELLLADAAHTSSDVMASLLVLVSFVGARLGLG